MYQGVRLHYPSQCQLKVSPRHDMSLPASPLSKSNLLIILPLQGPILHHTGSLSALQEVFFILFSQSHGRSQHGCQKGVIDLGPGLITSKMFDKVIKLKSFPLTAAFLPFLILKNMRKVICSRVSSSQPVTNLKMPSSTPLRCCMVDPELFQLRIFSLPGDSVFYCYYERVAARKLWYFFVRHFGVKEVLAERILSNHPTFVSSLVTSGWLPSLWAMEDWLAKTRIKRAIFIRGRRRPTVWEGETSTARDLCWRSQTK